jgi:magnesium transporter
VIRAWLADATGVRPVEDPCEAARAALAGSGCAWIDFAEEPEAHARAVFEALDLHPLVVEAMITRENRPRVDDYGRFLYLVLHSARWEGEEPFVREIDIVVAERYLLTYHAGRPRAIEAAHATLPRRPGLLADGPGPLLHYVLDTLVDQYFPIMDRVADELDALEEQIFEPEEGPARRVFALKRVLSALRRVVGPQRDTVLALTRDEFRAIPATLRPYLRDVYDRMARIGEMIESFRDEIATLLELHTASTSNRLNEVIKRLTIVATIGLPLTLITSWYGMNFPFPEYGWRWGAWWVLGWCAVAAGATWWYLKRNRWL